MTTSFARRLSDGKAGFPQLLEAIEAWLEERGVPPGPSAQLMIAFDEIVSNVLNHGGDEHAPVVDVSLKLDEHGVLAEVSDDGTAFDPLTTPAPDTTLSVEDRDIGGLGIHLVRELMDDVSYTREENRNRLRFSKNCTLDSL